MTQDISEAEQESNSDDLCHFTVLKGDVTQQHMDVIGLVIPHHLEIKGSLNRSVFQHAGSELDDYILEHIIAPKPGDVFVTPGFHLRTPNLIFAVIPSWRSDLDVLDKHIKVAISQIFDQAYKHGFRSIALPPICLGKIGYKPERGIRLLQEAMFSSFRAGALREIRFVSQNQEHINIYKARLQKVLGQA